MEIAFFNEFLGFFLGSSKKVNSSTPISSQTHEMKKKLRAISRHVLFVGFKGTKAATFPYSDGGERSVNFWSEIPSRRRHTQMAIVAFQHTPVDDPGKKCTNE